MADSSKSYVLVVDDEIEHAEVMSEALSRLGFGTEIAHNLPEAQKKLGIRKYDVIVTDLAMDGKRDGLELLKQTRELDPVPPVILVTAHNDVPTSKEALKQGAYDYIVKPLDLDEFRAQVNRAAETSQLRKQNEILEARVSESGSFEGIIGKSAAIQNVIRMARQVAQSDLPVLILGESGTGKELFAKAIHHASRRHNKNFVALNCAAFGESMLEGQLFGHVKGAFTNAIKDHEGVFEHANHGTVFLDEIGDMPGPMQAKLLRVLENGEVVRVGTNTPRRVDVRMVSATNADLAEKMAEKTFREDLYYRIAGLTITIPPLRERREDIPLLAYAFVKSLAQKNGRQIDGISPAVNQLLMNYHWPGNVRQLQKVAESAVVFAQGSTIQPNDLPPEVRPSGSVSPMTHSMQATVPMSATATPIMDDLASMTKDELLRAQIIAALAKYSGNREQAAKSLGMGERTLYRKIKEYGL
jgi:two-component system response regulator HydG